MPKQRYQDPTIQRNKNGSYYIRPWVDVLDKDGKLAREKRTIVLGTSELGERKARAKKNEVMRTLNNTDHVVKSQIPFKMFVVKYRKEHLEKQGHAQQCKFDWAMKKHLSAFDDWKLSEMNTLKLQEWFNAKQEKGLAKASRTGLKTILSGIFERAIAWQVYLGANPVHGVQIHGLDDSREKRKLSDAHTREFLAALPYDVRLLCSTSLFCTLRVTEAFALQEKHLDFDQGLILIRQSFYRGVLREAPKTKKGKRDIPMGYLKDDLRRICTGDPENFVFKIRTAPKWGRDVSYCRDDRDLNQHFLRPAAKKLGFYYKGFGFRALRREAITELSSVAGIGQAMNAAGHSTVDMSLLYTVSDQQAQEQAIRQRQERLLGQPQGGVQ